MTFVDSWTEKALEKEFKNSIAIGRPARNDNRLVALTDDRYPLWHRREAMFQILGSEKPASSHARIPAARKRRSRTQRPFLEPLEDRAMMASFQGFAENRAGQAMAVSADGNVVVGEFNNMPYEWTQTSNGVQATRLSNSSGVSFGGYASAVSADGSVIAGQFQAI